MTRICPTERPQVTREMVEAWVRPHGPMPKFGIVGRRGYYRDAMGEVGENDCGIYDDSLTVVTPQAVVSFNANTDPSREYPGVAVLQPGFYVYRMGIHGLTKPKERRYEALVQGGSVAIVRHGETTKYHGWFGINIHRGSTTGTSSEGCQTIVPAQWLEFLELVRSTLERAQVQHIYYILTQRSNR